MEACGSGDRHVRAERNQTRFENGADEITRDDKNPKTLPDRFHAVAWNFARFAFCWVSVHEKASKGGRRYYVCGRSANHRGHFIARCGQSEFQRSKASAAKSSSPRSCSRTCARSETGAGEGTNQRAR